VGGETILSSNRHFHIHEVVCGTGLLQTVVCGTGLIQTVVCGTGLIQTESVEQTTYLLEDTTPFRVNSSHVTRL
jgi:hypothetical protein